MVGLINRIGAKKWHDDRFYQKFERDAESQAGGDAAGPALGPYVADFAPGRARQPDPLQHQHGTDRHYHFRHEDIAGKDDDQNRNDSEWPESAQARRRIAGWWWCFHFA
ncbi:MAG: hypothetical protein DMG57_33790 [Acidobacteria bacterium]|nr:MAG: hypothetical protein DMG57_33790 [Acidobacteriota bacterium]